MRTLHKSNVPASSGVHPVQPGATGQVCTATPGANTQRAGAAPAVAADSSPPAQADQHGAFPWHADSAGGLSLSPSGLADEARDDRAQQHDHPYAEHKTRRERGERGVEVDEAEDPGRHQRAESRQARVLGHQDENGLRRENRVEPDVATVDRSSRDVDVDGKGDGNQSAPR